MYLCSVIASLEVGSATGAPTPYGRQHTVWSGRERWGASVDHELESLVAGCMAPTSVCAARVGRCPGP